MQSLFNNENIRSKNHTFNEFLTSEFKKVRWYYLNSYNPDDNKNIFLKHDMLNINRAVSVLDIVFINQISIDMNLFSLENDFFNANINRIVKSNVNMGKLCIHLHCSEPDYEFSDHVLNALFKLHSKRVKFTLNFNSTNGYTFWKLLNMGIISYLNFNDHDGKFALSKSSFYAEIIHQSKLMNIKTILSHFDLKNKMPLLTTCSHKFDYLRCNILRGSYSKHSILS